MKTTRNTRGSALIMVMATTMIIVSVFMAAFTVVTNSANQRTMQMDYVAAQVAVENGINNAIVTTLEVDNAAGNYRFEMMTPDDTLLETAFGQIPTDAAEVNNTIILRDGNPEFDFWKNEYVDMMYGTSYGHDLADETPATGDPDSYSTSSVAAGTKTSDLFYRFQNDPGRITGTSANRLARKVGYHGQTSNMVSDSFGQFLGASRASSYLLGNQPTVGGDPMEEIVDVYQISSQSDPIGALQIQREASATIALKKAAILPPAALWVGGTAPNINANTERDWMISGKDHIYFPPPEDKVAAIIMPFTGKIRMQFRFSEAALDSALYLINPWTGEEELLLETNHPGDNNEIDRVSTEFSEGQDLIFFARIKEYRGDPTYDHYLVGQRDEYVNKAFGKMKVYKMKDDPNAPPDPERPGATMKYGDPWFNEDDPNFDESLPESATNTRYRAPTYNPDPNQYSDDENTAWEAASVSSVYDPGRPEGYKWQRTDPEVTSGQQLRGTVNRKYQVDNTNFDKVYTNDNSPREYEYEELNDKDIRMVSYHVEDLKSQGTRWRSDWDYDDIVSWGWVIPTNGNPPPVTREYIRPTESDYLNGREVAKARSAIAYAYNKSAIDVRDSYRSACTTFDTGSGSILVNESTIADNFGTSKFNIQAVKEAFLDDPNADGVCWRNRRKPLRIFDPGTDDIETFYIGGSAQGSASQDFSDSRCAYFERVHVTGDLTIDADEDVWGAGVMVVDGNLTVNGYFDYAGILIVDGDLTLSPGIKNAFLRGIVICTGNVTITGRVDLYLSKSAITRAYIEFLPTIGLEAEQKAWRFAE